MFVFVSASLIALKKVKKTVEVHGMVQPTLAVRVTHSCGTAHFKLMEVRHPFPAI